MNENKADFLFARPSFAEGIGRLADLAGSLNTYNSSRSGAEADGKAIAADWSAVGDAFYDALDEFAEENREIVEYAG